MPLLQLTDLRKGYVVPDGSRQSVIDIPRFTLDAGQQVALAGSSGCGKTTLLNLIAGILRPDGGTITLDGTELTALREAGRDAVRAQHIGYVFQTFNLLQGYTALENVLLGMMFGPGPDRAFAAGLLTELGLGDRLDYRPSQLSIGQQQRVALARALANRPKLVLADEPTGSLDASRASEAIGLIQSACREHDASLLLVSHDPAVLERFEHRVDLLELNRAATAAAPEPAAEAAPEPTQ